MATAEDTYINKRTIDNTPLSSSAQAFYNWYIKNNREDRQKQMQLTDMDEFSDLFRESKIIEDKNWVRNKRFKDKRDFTQHAEIAEYMIKTLGDDAEWFGEDSIIGETLEYDDRKNYADFVVEWDNSETGERDCALAVDITTSSVRSTVKGKIDKMGAEIQSGKLTEIKYFESQLSGDHETLSLIPRVVIVFDKEALNKICDDLVQHSENIIDYKGVYNDIMSLFILKTSYEQLKKQLSYITDLENTTNASPQKYTEVKESINKTFTRIKRELKAKEEGLSDEVTQQAYSLLKHAQDLGT